MGEGDIQSLPSLAVDTVGLAKSFGEVRAVRGLDLRVKRGEIYGLVGPDGAGKTTTLRMLCGVLTPDGGRVRVLGHDAVADVEKVREKIGYMSPRFSLYGDLTVMENLLFYADLSGCPGRRESARGGCWPSAGWSRSSTGWRSSLWGMKQKLALAAPDPRPRAAAAGRADDGGGRYPGGSSGDPVQPAGPGVTILVSTPYMDEAERCNSVGFMAEGKVVVSDTPQRLKEQMGKDVLELRAEPRRAAKAALQSVPLLEDVRVFGDTLHLVTSDAPAAERATREVLEREGIELLSLRPIAPTMEDAFMSLSSSPKRD